NNNNLFGDYTGMDFYGGILHPLWTDNSNSTSTNVPAQPNPDGAGSGFDMCTAAVPQSGGPFTANSYFPLQWGLFVTGVTDAWRFTTGSSDVLLVSLDGGLKIAPTGTGGDDLDPARLVTNSNSFGSNDEHGHESISEMAAMADNHWDIAGINWTSSVRVANVYKDGWIFGLVGSYSLDQGIQDAITAALANKQRIVFQGGIQGESWLTGAVSSLIGNNQDNTLVAVAAGNGGPGGAPFSDPNYLTSVSGVAKLESTD